MSANPIGIVDLLPGAQKINNGNVSDTWLGMASDGKHRIRLYAKRLAARELFIEVISAVLGRQIGLPVPNPFLVRVIPLHLPDAHLSKSEIFFGSEDAIYPTLSRFAKFMDAESRLKKWPHLIAAACFDEWIANSDRHEKNILYDGGNKFVLIDHGGALPEKQHALAGLTRNSFLRLACQEAGRAKKAKILEIIKSKNLPSYSRILEQDWSKVSGISNEKYFPAEKSGEIVKFLEQRLHAMGPIMHESLEVFQGDLYDNH